MLSDTKNRAVFSQLHTIRAVSNKPVEIGPLRSRATKNCHRPDLQYRMTNIRRSGCFVLLLIAYYGMLFSFRGACLVSPQMVSFADHSCVLDAGFVPPKWFSLAPPSCGLVAGFVFPLMFFLSTFSLRFRCWLRISRLSCNLVACFVLPLMAFVGTFFLRLRCLL